MRNSSASALKSAGFSLIEVSIAMAIAAVALIALIGVLPTAMRGSSDGADQTAIGVMLGDIHDRIEGSLFKVGTIPALEDEDAFFYDMRGVFVDPNSSQGEDNSIITARFYRVEIELIKPSVPEDSQSGSKITFGETLAVSVKIFWPIDSYGNPIRPDKPGSVITYLASPRTGPAWRAVDPGYEPVIEH